MASDSTNLLRQSFVVPVYFFRLGAVITQRLTHLLTPLETEITQLDFVDELQTQLVENPQALIFFGINKEDDWQAALTELDPLLEAGQCLLVTCPDYELTESEQDFCLSLEKLADHVNDCQNLFMERHCRLLVELQAHRIRLTELSAQEAEQRPEQPQALIDNNRADPVTGLASVSLMRHFLIKAMARVLRNDRCLAVLFLDIDDFHCINESFGVDGGDRLLRSVGNRLKDCIRTGDLVSRFKDDAFVVVLDEVRNQTDVEKLAQQMLQQLLSPHDVHGIPVIVQASIGIAFYPQGTVGVETLIEQSKQAMEWVKLNGKNGHQVHGRESIKTQPKGRSIMH